MPSVEITFQNLLQKDLIKRKKLLKNWIVQIIELEHNTLFGASFAIVLCNDEYISVLNKNYLKHNTLTDIITFDYSEGKNLMADIIISAERISENAKKYNVSFDTELYRVMAHGVLHVLGYSDKSTAEKKKMKEKENYYLILLQTMLNQ